MSNQKYTALLERHKKLDFKRVRFEADLDNAKKQLEKLLESAKEKYGTDNLDELRQLYAKQNRENQTLLENFEISLDNLEQKLSQLESGLG